MFAAMSAGEGVDEGEEGAVVGWCGEILRVRLFGWQGVRVGGEDSSVLCFYVGEKLEAGLRGWCVQEMCISAAEMGCQGGRLGLRCL